MFKGKSWYLETGRFLSSFRNRKSHDQGSQAPGHSSAPGCACARLATLALCREPSCPAPALATRVPRRSDRGTGTTWRCLDTKFCSWQSFSLYFTFHLMATAAHTAKSRIFLISSAVWSGDALTVFQLCWALVLGPFSFVYLHRKSPSFLHLCNVLHLYKQPTAPSGASVSAQW